MTKQKRGISSPLSPSKKEMKELKEMYPQKKRCPKCGKNKDVETKFGYRHDKRNGLFIAQSYCTECR